MLNASLDMSKCLIADVTMLSGVRTLDLSDCPNISNVDALGGVHRLRLDRTHINLDSIPLKPKCRADWLWLVNLRPNPDYLAADVLTVTWPFAQWDPTT